MKRRDSERQIRQARPKLRDVAPITYWITKSTAIFNIIFGLSLLFGLDSLRWRETFFILNDFLTSELWGAIFIMLGMYGIISLGINSWTNSRRYLLAGVAVKATWTTTSAARALLYNGTFMVNILWATLAMIQIVTYIFFHPRINKE